MSIVVETPEDHVELRLAGVMGAAGVSILSTIVSPYRQQEAFPAERQMRVGFAFGALPASQCVRALALLSCFAEI
jgi:hypothetical protein